MAGLAVDCANGYIDADVAYLIGMLFGRGQLIVERDIRRLIITLTISRTTPKLPPDTSLNMNLDVENERSLNQVRQRINNLLDANVDIIASKSTEAVLTAVFTKQTIGWRDISQLVSGGSDRANFVLPAFFFRLPQLLLKEFLRGFADVAVTPSFADNAFGKRARIAFPVVNPNVYFARQLVEIFRLLGVTAPLLEGSAAKRGGTLKEHRIRPFASDYETIGFHFSHKQRLLEILAEHDRGCLG